MILLLYICLLSTFIGESLCTDNCDFPDTVRCADKSKCIHTSDICNFMPDCDDYSDENPDFCQEWPRTNECRFGYIMCPSAETYILNYCITLSEACLRGCSVMPSLETCKIIDSKQLPSNKHEFGCLSNQHVELLKVLSESFSRTIDNSSGIACPSLYSRIGEYCVSTFLPASIAWEEAQLFCDSIRGDLLVVNDVAFLKEILDFFQEKKIVGEFWIGGKYDKKNEWTWLSGQDVPVGAPFWGLMHNQQFCSNEDLSCRSHTILPKLSSDGRCISMSFSFYYYFSDEPCLSRRSPLCLYDPDKTS